MTTTSSSEADVVDETTLWLIKEINRMEVGAEIERAQFSEVQCDKDTKETTTTATSTSSSGDDNDDDRICFIISEVERLTAETAAKRAKGTLNANPSTSRAASKILVFIQNQERRLRCIAQIRRQGLPTIEE
jgi:uncharacterized small protein (DUF1192 family)